MGKSKIAVAEVYVRPKENPQPIDFPFPLYYTSEPIKIGFDYKMVGSSSVSTTTIMDDFNSRVASDRREHERTIVSIVEWNLNTKNQGSFTSSIGMANGKGSGSALLNFSSDNTLTATTNVKHTASDKSVQTAEARISSEMRVTREKIETQKIELVDKTGYIRTVLEIHNPTRKTVSIQAVDLVFSQYDSVVGRDVPLTNVVLGGSTLISGTVPGAIKVEQTEGSLIEVPPTLPGRPFVRTISIEQLPNQLMSEWLKRGTPLSVRVNSTRFRNASGDSQLSEEMTIPFIRDHVQIAILSPRGAQSLFFLPAGKMQFGEYLASLNDEGLEYVSIDELPNSRQKILSDFLGYTSDRVFFESSLEELYDAPQDWSAETGFWMIETSSDIDTDDLFAYIPQAGDRFRVSWVCGADVVKAAPPKCQFNTLIATLPASAPKQNRWPGFPFSWFGGELGKLIHPGAQTAFSVGDRPLPPASFVVSEGTVVQIRYSGLRSFFKVEEENREIIHPQYGKMADEAKRRCSQVVENIGSAAGFGLGMIVYDHWGGEPVVQRTLDLSDSKLCRTKDVGDGDFVTEIMFDASFFNNGMPMKYVSLFNAPPVFVGTLGYKVIPVQRNDLAGVPGAAPPFEPFPWIDGEEIQEAQFVSLAISCVYRPLFLSAPDGKPSSLDPDSYVLGVDNSNADYHRNPADLEGGWPFSSSIYASQFPYKNRCVYR